MSRHIYKVGRTQVTLGVDRPLASLFGLVRKSRTPRPLTTEEIPVSEEGLRRLFQLARQHGPIPESCREAIESEVNQFLAGSQTHNVVVLHRNERDAKKRLEELRQELRNECLSYGELAELESLREYIELYDVELMSALGDCR